MNPAAERITTGTRDKFNILIAQAIPPSSEADAAVKELASSG
jgi:hypothetical protein